MNWSNDVGRRIPNILTMLRVLLIPVFVFLLVDPTPDSSLWATGIFIVASLTDWLDGYLARLYHAESILGTMLDPLADKLLTTAALVMLAAAGPAQRIPAWIVVALLSREMVVTGLRSVAAIQNVVVPAGRWAKHKTAWTMLALVCLLVGKPYMVLGVEINFYISGMVFLWLALFFSVATGIGYAVSLRRMFLD